MHNASDASCMRYSLDARQRRWTHLPTGYTRPSESGERNQLAHSPCALDVSTCRHRSARAHSGFVHRRFQRHRNQCVQQQQRRLSTGSLALQSNVLFSPSSGQPGREAPLNAPNESRTSTRPGSRIISSLTSALSTNHSVATLSVRRSTSRNESFYTSVTVCFQRS